MEKIDDYNSSMYYENPFYLFPLLKNPAEVEADNFSNIDEISSSDSLKPPVIHCRITAMHPLTI